MLKRIIFRRLSPFLFGIHSSNSLISPHQYGFRSKFSIAHALIDATQFIRSQLDLENTVLGLFLDFSKAFDMVDYSVLLSKLNNLGIHGVPFSWFGSYLSGRVQSVSLGGVTSHPLPVRRGVPQGSVPGLILFSFILMIWLRTWVHQCTQYFLLTIATFSSLVLIYHPSSPLLKPFWIEYRSGFSLTAWPLTAREVRLYYFEPLTKKWSPASTWPKIFYQSPPTGRSCQVSWCPHRLLPIICNTCVLHQSQNLATGKYN